MKVAMPRLRAVAAAALGAATALPWASSFHAALGVGAPAAGSALAHRGRAAMGPAVRGPHMALSGSDEEEGKAALARMRARQGGCRRAWLCVCVCVTCTEPPC